jgi:hypothetical protein
MSGTEEIVKELWELVGLMRGIRREIAQGFEALHCALDKTWEEDGKSEESENDEEEVELEEGEVEGMMDDLYSIHMEHEEAGFVGPSAH